MKLKLAITAILFTLACLSFTTSAFAQPQSIYKRVIYRCGQPGEFGQGCIQGTQYCTEMWCP